MLERNWKQKDLKLKVERSGNPIYGVYVRSEILIEPVNNKIFKEDNYEIEKLLDLAMWIEE